MALNPHVAALTDRIRQRSHVSRNAYLAQIREAASATPHRCLVSCANLAHSFAASGADKAALREGRQPNIGIVTAYNDMLSAHQPLEAYPAWIRQAARAAGATAQVAGGVPAMCDGITQGQPGMELSLFSRDVIAMSTAVALSHSVFDAALCLGVCDKIVPGLLIGALQFGHLPVLFVPGGPMVTGISNEEKARVRQRAAAGEADRAELLESEAKAYSAPGTCTFYGTANSNQMLMEIMGLHLPGTAFVPAGSPLREALTRRSAARAVELVAGGSEYTPLGLVIDERAIVNGMVGLLATGGSTNHTLHLVAIARAAGIHIDWSDFDTLSAQVPLLARVYPNGEADVNAFHKAGGMGFLIRELLNAGLLHDDVLTVAGPGLRPYTQAPELEPKTKALVWREAPAQSRDEEILRPFLRPFSHNGGLRLLTGNLGRSVIKVSSVKPEYRHILAQARVFDSQEALQAAYQAGSLNRNVVVVVRFQGPRANGMPELHQLTPPLANLLDRGYRVALITDGRMSGASGKVPAAIHASPEALAGGPLAKIQDGDLIELDAERGTLEVRVDPAEWALRPLAQPPSTGHDRGLGRELFGLFRAHATTAEAGATSFGPSFDRTLP
ncbi:phosphogluconate dehydratase [Geothrix sp. PMB-07]|uniref:phosphogluconate dehydratase n=1 Tax=Geothrix sp. PMB-07 TaxID=3068640 RepID=UPI0027407AF1|nr:phosphogluconate dehydratase [Geothrix sp. PMB-07]WLT31690.1 phosphogluconate dehydratase [Geothrix sp. PMB-07]